MGRDFGWLWSASTVSSLGSSFALGAFPLIAVRVLHASAAQVSALPAVGIAAGAVLAVPLGPWVEKRRKRPVMVAMDLVRFLVMASIPLAYAFGKLTFAQLLAASVIAAAAKIAFASASGANLKYLVPRDKLMIANARLASANWITVTVGPPLGGAAITLLGPVASVTADAVSYVLSALGVLAIRGEEPRPRRHAGRGPSKPRDLAAGWRYIFGDPVLRRLMANQVLTAALILATEPLLAVLLLRQLKFTAWMYGMAFGIPCAGGFVASRLSARMTARLGRQRMLLVAGTARACFPIGLALTFAGSGGLAFFIVVQTGLIVFMGLFTPLYATYRLELLGDDHVSRGLTAWSVTSNATIAVTTGLWGVLATLTTTRVAIAVAGVLLLATPALLPRDRGFARKQLSRAVLRRGRAVRRAEHPAKGGRVPESPAGADSADRVVAQSGVEQVLAAAFQPSPPDRGGDGLFLRLTTSAARSTRSPGREPMPTAPRTR
jgi:MFS family permease